MNDNSKRGLASADEQTRQRVAHEGGQARAQDEDVKSGELGRKGGEATKKKYGPEFYQEIGQKGGQARSEDEDVKSGELGRQGGESSWGDDDDM